MSKTKQMYSRADTLIAYLKKFVKNEFNRMGLLGFDELNVLNTQSQTDQLYTRLKNENQKLYMDASKNAQAFALKLIALMRKGYTGLDLDGLTTGDFEKYVNKENVNTDEVVESNSIGSLIWLVAFLGKYNRNTGYLYESEADRKRMRYNEEILTAREYGDRGMFNQSTQRSANLWYGQSEQYLLDVVDEATIETYGNNNVKYVMWMTEGDSKVCSECQSRHGFVYAIDEIPDKPHKRCRCYLIPMVGKNKRQRSQ